MTTSSIHEGLLTIAEAARSAAIEDGVEQAQTSADDIDGLGSYGFSVKKEDVASDAVDSSSQLQMKGSLDLQTRNFTVTSTAIPDDVTSQPVPVTSAKSKVSNPIHSSAKATNSGRSPASSASTNVAAPPSGTVTSGSKRKGPLLRRGKWTMEEEAYANRLIQEFKAGLLPLTDGTTLRTFLSKLLNCDPMRISKKFVGGNCIGKQVFRRRTAEINRLTPEQIKQSKLELSDLERRFLDRVAQTTKVKTPGPSGAAGHAGGTNTGPIHVLPTSIPIGGNIGKPMIGESANDSSIRPSTPPWLRPPATYKPGNGAAMALSDGIHGRYGNHVMPGNSHDLLSHNDLASSTVHAGTQSVPHGFAQRNDSIGDELSQTILSQLLAHHNSSAQLNGGTLPRDNSMVDAILKTAMSHEHISQLVRDGTLNSSASLSYILQRQSSLDALISLDLQSLNSMDNLSSLALSSNTGTTIAGRSNLKSLSASDGNDMNHAFSNSFTFTNARRLASGGHLEQLMSSLSNNNGGNKLNGGHNPNFPSFLQNVQNHPSSSFNNSFTGPATTSVNASDMNMLRVNSSTGLTALRMQDGLGQRNSSVEDFLSLMASGDIPHQDPNLLNVPFHGHFLVNQQAGPIASSSAQQQFSLSQHRQNNKFNVSSGMDELGEPTASLKKRKVASAKI